MSHSKTVDLSQTVIGGDSYYQISNSDQMNPFFMSVVSDSNHWMFISSNGGLTAGRIDADHALFPYYTDDKVTESFDLTGSKSIFRVSKSGKVTVWEPFSIRFEGLYQYSRNVYKSVLGNKIIFEEINHDLNLTFRYKWSTSDQFGFIRQCTLTNQSNDDLSIEMVDGIQDIMPYGVGSDTQFIRSNLVDAYKRSQLEADAGLGIYALSAIIVDRAEPSEALKANIAWSLGLENPTYLLCAKQLDAFRRGVDVLQETDIKARKGSYLAAQKFSLKSGSQKEWMIIADVNYGPSAVAAIRKKIQDSTNIAEEIEKDINKGTKELVNLNAASDAYQLTSDKRRNTRHYSNTLFNIMRGGIFDHNYQMDQKDFSRYLSNANRNVYKKYKAQIKNLGEHFSIQDLKELSSEISDADLTRLATEYLPLKFSRRHGDPSRPWNRFSINTKDEAGDKVLDYEGNWRDIFQNWEALAHSYPEFIEGMIFKFLNASTFDGYNPYRVTKDGFDWEVIEEHDPWSYIGYWGDHQVIYLQKFLEFIEGHYPGRLNDLFNDEVFVFANVPYKIKSYEDTLRDPKDTIVFDDELDRTIHRQRDQIGADGALIRTSEGDLMRVNFMEKILAMALAKLSNFIPEAGIWMNTQRPEWNDANNALVGNGVSMVTLCYLRRFFHFFEGLLKDGTGEVQVSAELSDFFEHVAAILKTHEGLLSGSISDKDRRAILDGLGEAGSQYRDTIYHKHYSGNKKEISLNDISSFSSLVIRYLDHSIDANKREDNMYHAYNLMGVENGGVTVDYLDEMLEGQVAVLSSGKLSAAENLAVLDGLKSSALFRPDQYSYVLYPNKDLPRFTEKNIIPAERVAQSQLLKTLVEQGNVQIIEKDVNGEYHFNGKFTNADGLANGLAALTDYEDFVAKERDLVLEIFEEVFNHKAFTGRSGTFYGYEGLGSIYWHMVSKLLLATEECCLSAIKEGADEGIVGRLMEHYYEINEGIGVHKSPELYGAFPTDPYSHTPFGKGVQQPGMTGQVKEDILSRIGELGVQVESGQIHFDPHLLKADEFLKEEVTFEYADVTRQRKELNLSEGSLAFTYCQVPVIYKISESESLDVVMSKGNTTSLDGLVLPADISSEIFKRTGTVDHIVINLTKNRLR